MGVGRDATTLRWSPREDKPARFASWRVRSKELREEKLSLIFMPAIFSAAAQLLVKGAAKYEVKTTNWLIFIGLSLVSYMMAFGSTHSPFATSPTVSLVP